MTLRHCVAAVAVLALASGCGAKTPDYQLILPATTTTAPASTVRPVPISDYLDSVGVTGEPVPLAKLTDLKVSIPTPPGWSKYNNSALNPATEAIAKNGTYPTALVLVLRLTGNFDVAEAIKHGNADAELSEHFVQQSASTADFQGFPSAMIEGSYDLNGQRLNSYNRIVIATGAEHMADVGGKQTPVKERYLVQLTVTSAADKAVPRPPDVDAIISGFTVAAK